MDSRESTEKFKAADRLFREGQYQQALHLLGELNAAYPNTKNILYPAALCLEKLGRGNEALPLCDSLIRTFQDPRAEKLKRQIEAAADPPAPSDNPYGLDFSGVDASAIQGDLLDIPTTTYQYKPVEPEPFPWLKYSLIGLGVAAALAVVIVPVLIYEPPAAPPPGTTETTRQFRPGVSIAGFIGMLIIVQTFQTVGAYIALMLMRSLPHRDFWSNAFNIGASMFLASLLESSLFGFLLTIYWFAKAYDLGFLGILLLYTFRIVFFIVGFVVALLFMGALVGITLQDFSPT